MEKYQTLKFLFALLLFVVGGIIFIFGVGWSVNANTAKDYVISSLLLLAATALMEFYAVDQLTGFFSGDRQPTGSLFRVKAWCIAITPIIFDLLHFGFSIYRLSRRK